MSSCGSGRRARKRTGRVLPVDYQAERRQHAQAGRAAFVVPPSGPNQVWQLDFSEFETRHGGTWRIGGVGDYWSKLELGWHVSTTANHRDAIETVEQAISESERRPELIHIRTRRKTPQQNGVRERAFGSLKYEHLYRLEIDDGHTLGQEVETYRQLFNTIRPHEGIAIRRPLDVHLEASNDRQTIKSTEPETLPLSWRASDFLCRRFTRVGGRRSGF